MITAYDFKNLLNGLNGETMYFHGYCLKTTKGSLNATLYYEDRLLLQTKDGGSSSICFYLPDENRKDRISYEKEAVLYPNDTLLKVYDVFSFHGSITEVILALMTLEECVRL